jgi:hypothetical protein
MNSDEEQFKEIKGLIDEGWRFRGNFFEQDQIYRLMLNKEGAGERVFRTAKPYPQIVDIAGRMIG